MPRPSPHPALSPQAEYQRAYRDRQRTGARVFRGEADAELMMFLIGADLITPTEAGDQQELGAALVGIVDRWRRGVLGSPPRLYEDGGGA